MCVSRTPRWYYLLSIDSMRSEYYATEKTLLLYSSVLVLPPSSTGLVTLLRVTFRNPIIARFLHCWLEPDGQIL